MRILAKKADYDPFAEDIKPSLWYRALTAVRDYLRQRKLARMYANMSEFPMGEFPDSDEYIRATGDMSHVC